MSNRRISNDGGSYGFYARERSTYTPAPETELAFYVTSNRIENGVRGLPLGDNQYLHEGQPQKEAAPKSLPKEYESGYANTRVQGYSRLEHEHSASDFDQPDPTIISATPKFDFLSGRAELVIEYSNRKQKVVSASNKEILNWVQSELIRRLV